ncbi:MAG: alpha/beta hydrolase family protein [Gemmatimonadota bacterium]
MRRPRILLLPLAALVLLGGTLARRAPEPTVPVRHANPLGTLALGTASPAALPTSSRQSASGEAFVVLRGADTLAIERFTRSARRLDGDLADHGARDVRETYVAYLEPEGRVGRLELAVRPGNAARNTPPLRRAAVTFNAEEAFAEALGGGSRTRFRVDVSPGALPYLTLSSALLEQMAIRARALGGDRVELPLVEVGEGRALAATVLRSGPDSLRIVVDGLAVEAAVDSAGRLLGGHVPSQGLTIQRVAARDAETLDRVDYSASSGAPYVAEEVRVRATARHTLAGTLTLPTFTAGPFPGVVLVTGSGPQERDATFLGSYRPFRQIADVLSRRGVAVLRLDDRGVGASTGSFTNATSADFADDVRSALTFLRARPEIDGERLALIGESEGGLVATMVAATDPELRGLVLMGTPSRTGRSLIASQVRYRLEREGKLPPAERDSVVTVIEARNERLARVLPWLRFILDYDPIATAVNVGTPVLILQGETDRQVFANQAGELGVAFRGGGNQDVTVRIFPNLNHLFLEDPDGDPELYPLLASKALPAAVLDTIAGWVTGHLL